MKKRKRSRIPSRTLYCFQKRVLAFLLAAAMILANVGADTNQVYAASSSESVTFSMGGSQLIKAIEDAIINGDEVTAEDLDFTNGKIAEFKELFFGKGKIYEAFPEVEGEGMDAQLRVFVRIPENADDMYMVTGDEEIVFLYVNNGENTISCSTEITRLDDGAEKVKKTNRITVRSYESAFGKEEVNVVTKPEQPTVTGETKVPETATPAEAGKVVETAPVKETTAAEETVSAPEKVTSAPEETTITPPEIPAQLPEETIADPAESQTESPAEETVKESAESEEITVPESKVSEPVASIIRHNAPIVAVKENGEATKASEVSEETAAVDPENVRESKETEASTKAEMTQAETTQVEATQVETTQAESQKAESTQAETSQIETTQAETTQAPAESQTSSAGNNTAGGTTNTTTGTASPSESKPIPETPASETKASPAGTADLVGMGYCSTAKAYTVTINQLKALEDYDGYKISYTINPEASARIIEGPRGVEEGQELTFGVKNQIGYAIESVTANGQILNSDSATDNTDGSQTTWYSVPEIYEDQEVEVHMTETGEHPEFSSQLVMEDGTIIRLHAPEGVLPAGVKASAVVVSGIGAAVKEKVEAQSKEDGEAKEVISSLSYNIDLLDRNGNKLDNQIWNGSVQVTFSGTPMENHSKEANTVEVVYVATTKEDEPQAKVTAADVSSVEPVSEELNVQENKGIKEISFEAEHFSTYTIVFGKYKGKTVQLNIVKYDNGIAVPIGTNSARREALDTNTTVSIKDIAPDVNGYTFEKATIGSDYMRGEVVRSLEYAGFILYSLMYENSSSKWKEVDNNDIYLWYSQKGITVQFDPNGGKGTAPTKNVKAGEVIDLPDGTNFTRANYRFMGWSESPDGGKITAKGNAGYNEVYTETFTIKENEPAKPKTLYAVWAQDKGDAKGRLWVAVLKDGGDLPSEPRNQANRDYEFIYKDSGSSYKTIGYGDNLLNYINPLITVTGKDNVQANLNDKFYQAVDDWESNHLKSNEYIEWYVIKYESSACGTEGWHVDGIIRNNKSFYVDYAGNGNTGGLTPDGQKYTLNTKVTVAMAGGYEGGNWIPLKKEGYVFNGWNTRSDGSGVAFDEGKSFNLTQEFINANHSAAANTVTLYAQWKLKNSVQINYRAVGGGNVSPSSENLNPDIGNSKGAAASPNRGYKLSGWYRDAGCKDLISTSVNFKPERPVGGWVNDTTFYAKFEVDNAQTFSYQVNYYIKDTEKEVPGLNAITGSRPIGEYKWKNDAKTATGYKLAAGQPESMIVTAAGPNIVNVYYEVDEDQKLNYTIKYFYNNKEDRGAEVNLKILVADPFVKQVPLKEKAGYKLSVTNPALPTAITTVNDTISVYYVSDQVSYVVNMYYQVNGEYAKEPTFSDTRSGLTESKAEVTDADRKSKKTGYVFDESAKENVLSGTVAGDGSLVLKAYFKQQFTVTYAPGTQGNFEIQKAEGLEYNATTPKFNGTPAGKPGYEFTGWSPSVEPAVKADAMYVAQWKLKEDIKINFQPVGPGSVSPMSESLNPDIGVSKGSTATANKGYKLIGWYSDKECTVPVSTSVKYTPGRPAGGWINGTTFYANFVVDEAQTFSYQVNYYIKGTEKEVPGLNAMTGRRHIGEFTWTNVSKTATGYKLVGGQPESMMIKADGPNTVNVYYEVDKDQKLSYKVKYFYNNKEDGAAEEELKILVADPIIKQVPLKDKVGYKLSDRPYNPALPTTITTKNNTINVYYVPVEVKYVVNFYYQVDGKYVKEPAYSYIKSGLTESKAEVTADDRKTKKPGYVFDESYKDNVLSGTVAGNGSLVLKAYFKQQFTVTYAPGTQGNFVIQKAEGLDYNANTPIFNGTPTGKPGYEFAGWSPTIKLFVKADTIYVAQWRLKGDIKINYQPVGPGSVSPVSENLNPDIGDSKGSTATANKGYKLSGWYKDKDCKELVSTSGKYAPERPAGGWVNGTTFYAKFVVDEDQKFGYQVNYYIKDTEKEVPGLKAMTGTRSIGPFQWANEPKTTTGYKIVAGQPDNMIITVDGPNIVNVYYEVDKDQKLDYKVKYFYNNKEDGGAEESLKVLVAESTVNQVPLKGKAGYELSTTPYNPELPAIITRENNVINVYYVPAQVDYAVNLYYQVNGKYDKVPTYSFSRSGYTESKAEVSADDRIPKDPGYVFDESAKENVLDGVVAGNGSLVLKAYFKQQFTVTYDPGTQGNFKIQKAAGLDYNATTPGFSGTPAGKPGYEFTGWNPEIESVVNADTTYVAQWKLRDDIKINYKSVGAGYVSPASENLNPDIGDSKGSTATPNKGYKFSGWYEDEACTKLLSDSAEYKPERPATSWVNGATFYAKFDVDVNQKFSYKVNYYIKDTEKEVPGLNARTGSRPIGVFEWVNEPTTTTGYKLMADQPESMSITATGPNEKTVYYEVDENQTLNYKIKYFYNNTEDAGAAEKVLVADPTVTQVPLKDKVGYKLSDKPYSPELPTVITGENNVINVYYDPVKVHYMVDLYYQENGEYTEQPTYSYTRDGYTESGAEVTADDRQIKKTGYVFDEGKENVLSGAIAGDGSLVLKIYFKKQFTVTYDPGIQGTFKSQKAEGLDYNTVTPEYDGTPTGNAGYVFAGWSPKLEPVVKSDNTYVAQWISSTSTKYTVEFYYENQGKYPEKANNSSLRAGTTDALAAVTDSDKTASTGYILDSNAANVFEAAVAGDGGMVLKVYFKQQFAITYNPGEHGSFNAQTNTGLSYGDAVPAFEGQTTANGNYSFIGWNKEIAKTVSENVVYTALWTYNGGGSSGGSSGGGPRATGTRQAGGPGDTTVTIEPVPVPLANLPENTNLVTIDDGNIPLAGLPKTGDRAPVQGVAAIVSGILLAAYLAISHRRRDER